MPYRLLLLPALFLAAAPAAGQDLRYAKIFYSGDMKVKSISALINAIDDANADTDVDQINLYINSYGGDMDAGLMAAAAIRSSRKTVRTIAMTTVGSSATLMLCAGKERRALAESSIYLHPSFTHHEGDLRPNTIKELEKENNRFREMFRSAYQHCTNLGKARIEEILYSESNRITFTPQEAVKAGIVSALDEKIVDSRSAYYITVD